VEFAIHVKLAKTASNAIQQIQMYAFHAKMGFSYLQTQVASLAHLPA
jgi:hypothetical protein